MATRTKKNSTTILVYENDKFQFKKWTRTYSYDSVLSKWIKAKEEVTYETLESHGLSKKSIEVSAIFISERPSETLLSSTEISFFLGKFRFSIPKTRAYEHSSLSSFSSNTPIQQVPRPSAVAASTKCSMAMHVSPTYHRGDAF